MIPSADLIVRNGRLLGHPRGVTALIVSGGRIVAAGSDTDAAGWRGPATDVIDAGGATVMPGFDDAHMHLRWGALALDRLDLFGLSDLAAVQAAIAAYAAGRLDDEWITGRGWLYAAFPGGLPRREQLDLVVPDRPALLMCFDGHTGWANSRALEIAGLDQGLDDPVTGEVVRDADGRPTGALKERAVELVSRHVPSPSEERVVELMGQALDALAEAGITAAQDAWAEPADFARLDALAGRGRLPVRLRLALELLPGSDADERARCLDVFAAVVAGRERDPFVRGGILKSFVDGVVEARTAYMLEPYPGAAGGGYGEARWGDEELSRAVAEAHARGWQVELHAIGTAAVRQALDAYEALEQGEAARRRHRVEHIETIHPADLPRFAALGVVASMQPQHALPESSTADTWRSVLSPDVAATGWRIGSLLRSGARLAFGSDWPVVPYDPFLEVHAAVTRQTADGEPADGWLPDERVSLEVALLAATAGSAFAGHADGDRGSLSPGMLADLIVLDRDLLAEGPSAINGTRAVATIVDGTVVHRRG